jgi:hypothetical protein
LAAELAKVGVPLNSIWLQNLAKKGSEFFSVAKGITSKSPNLVKSPTKKIPAQRARERGGNAPSGKQQMPHTPTPHTQNYDAKTIPLALNRGARRHFTAKRAHTRCPLDSLIGNSTT